MFRLSFLLTVVFVLLLARAAGAQELYGIIVEADGDQKADVLLTYDAVAQRQRSELVSLSEPKFVSQSESNSNSLT